MGGGTNASPTSVGVGRLGRLAIRRKKIQTLRQAPATEGPEARLLDGKEPSPMVLQEERRPENKEFSPVDRLEEGPEARLLDGREPSPMVWQEERRPESKEFSPVDRLEEKLTSLGNSISAISGVPFREEDRAVIESVLRKAFAATSSTYGVQSAIDWGGGFKFDELLIERDSDELTNINFDLAELARRRQNAEGRRERRLNDGRAALLGGNGDIQIERLCDLAHFGVMVHRKPGFVENSEPPPLRKKYMLVASAVNKKLAEQLQLGNGILVRNTAARHISGIHYSSIHWTEQAGKIAGRVLMDPSNAEEGKDSLNSDEATEAAKEKYGEIRHPTIDNIIRMIIKMAELHGWDNIVLWKMDVKGAFTLLDFNPEDVRLLAYEVTGDLTYIPIAGIFGLGGMPFAFNVPTNVLRDRARLLVKGLLDVYCDDGIGCCHKDDRQHDMRVFGETIISILGEDAIAEDKSEWGRSMDVLGWNIDLDSMSFSLSVKNSNNAITRFVTLDENAGVKAKSIESLASLASRYSKVCREMKPYVGILFAELSRVGHRLHNGRRSWLILSESAKVNIRRWRAFLCLQELEPARFRRSMLDFADRVPRFHIKFDASLEGWGILVSEIQPSGSKKLILVSGFFVENIFNLNGDSSYQNTMEFTAIVIGLALLAQEGISDHRVQVMGDNISSLSWATCEKFCTGLSESAVTAFTVMGRVGNLFIEEGDDEHVRGEDNSECDDLSRGVSPEGLYDESLIRRFEVGSPIWDLIQACNPTVEFRTEREIGDHYRRIEDIVRRIKGPVA